MNTRRVYASISAICLLLATTLAMGEEPEGTGIVAIDGDVPDAVGANIGVRGSVSSTTTGATGVLGVSQAGSGINYGIAGVSQSPSGSAALLQNSGGGDFLLGLGPGDTEIIRFDDQGDFYKNGALFMSGEGDFGNVGLGHNAGPTPPSSTYQNNIAIGPDALNQASDALSNVAIGPDALGTMTVGNNNIAIGAQGLAGNSLQSGNDNIYIGHQGSPNDNGTIRIGGNDLQTSTFIEGINGAAVAGSTVVVDASNQLGVAVSSARYKDNIEDMGNLSEALYNLRPVTFNYIEDIAPQDKALQYGLIAEEVAKVYPELVINDEEGRPNTVLYRLLAPILLNEVQKLNARITELEAKLEAERR